MSSLFTMVYGLNEVVPRRKLWAQLAGVMEDVGDDPWLVLGDLNIVFLSEVNGMSGDISIAIGDFQACIRDTGLISVPIQGEIYTWHSCSDGSRSLWKKLDQMLANDH
ncbi:UNVERIFIED_CONTAM: hypothetical protein Sradi_5290400 [Sesamum radiatum]|uniref:Uncharacterized protein n=1 Tax=Sesamum radiatum TaxID=300843 RepID=A0AAW2LP58_SESRA